MCDTCGCDSDGGARIEGAHTHVMPDGTVLRHAHGRKNRLAPKPRAVPIEARVLARNDLAATRCRGWLDARGVVALNLMSSPGSGKTTLLERTLVALRARGRAASVLEGDQETTRDAERIRATGAPALQINTGKGCHLEAEMVLAGLAQLSPPPDSTLFIENVGNLVCPALFDLGEHARVVLFSVTEGEDKPLKYPHMFRAADVVLLTKVDLLPHLDVNVDAARAAVQRVKPGTPVIEVSARTGQGLSDWYAWLANAAATARVVEA